MIYLDYAANTPACPQAVEAFSQAALDFSANPNSTHLLGRQAAQRLQQASAEIAAYLDAQEKEVIFTSGATESNNLAILGAAQQYRGRGKHVITTYLEHSSVNGAMGVLQNMGFEVDYVDITPQGTVDLVHLRELLREDTILVSIVHVDSEIGLIQPIEEIYSLLQEYPSCFFHVDATQSVGKLPVSFAHADLMSFAPHKFYGINGCGVLLKKESLLLEPQMRGGMSTTPFRSGTPALALAVSAQEALAVAVQNRQQRWEQVVAHNQFLRERLGKKAGIVINSPPLASPFILNISLPGIRSEAMVEALDENGICLSSKSACCAANTPSRPVYALTKNRKAAVSTLRISLSHLTTRQELETFWEAFERCYDSINMSK